MTITIHEITHVTTNQALSYAMDYYANYYSPGDPPLTYHRFDHSEHIEVLTTWGHYDLFFVQSRIKQIVLYGLPSEWTDEVAMRGWVFYRDPVTGLWTTECDSTVTNLHHWQEIHALLKKESAEMSDILDLLTEIRDSTANTEALLNALASVGTDLLRVEGKDGDKLWAFESTVIGQTIDLNIPVGLHYLYSPTVPTDRIWIITQISWRYLGTPPSRMVMDIRHVTDELYLDDNLSPVSDQNYVWTGYVFMNATDRIRLRAWACTSGDDMWLRWSGVQLHAP